MTLTVAFLGLGVMGFPMAAHLVKAGHQVRVYNRSSAKAIHWASIHHGDTAPTARDAADNADFVFACVGNDDDIREVTTGPNGAFQTMKTGAVFVDHTTTSAAVSRELYDIARGLDIHFIDAPVSGGQAGAEDGVLTVMCGGDPEPYGWAEPVMKAYARNSSLIGPSGSGQLAKMVNQICIAGILQGLSEGLNFAAAAGLDPLAVVAAISKGAAQSWQMDNRSHTMVEGQFDFGFAVDWMRKDLGIALAEAQRNGAPLPLTARVDSYYRDVQAMGYGRYDTSSLITRLSRPHESSDPS